MRLKSSIKVGEFQGKDVIEYTFKGRHIEYKVLNLGCIIKGIYIENKVGKKENIVLTYENIEDYYKNSSYYGAIIGRTAGRIYDGKISLEDKEINFNKNYGATQCHGGNVGFNKKIWDAYVIENLEESRIIFSYKSMDGKENYPGNLNMKVIYNFKEDGFDINIEGFSDKDTLVNLTTHSYFNLSGDYKKSILKEKLTINSNEYLAIDENNAVTGEKINVIGTAFDFRGEKEIGRDIENPEEQLKIGAGYDHCFLFNEEDKEGKIRLVDEENGLAMEVSTDSKAVVIYTMNSSDTLRVEGGRVLDKRYGVCFECQNPPIGKNQCFKEDSILMKDEKYRREINYKFFRF